MLQTDTGDAAKRQATLAHLAEERDERFTVIGTSYSPLHAGPRGLSANKTKGLYYSWESYICTG